MDKQAILDRILVVDQALGAIAAQHQSVTQQLQQLTATHQNLTGQKAECSFWLAELEKGIELVKDLIEPPKVEEESELDEDVPQ